MTKPFKKLHCEPSVLILLFIFILIASFFLFVEGKKTVELKYPQRDKSYSAFLNQLLTNEFSSCDLFYVFDKISISLTSATADVDPREFVYSNTNNIDSVPLLPLYVSSIQNDKSSYSGLSLVRKNGGQCALVLIAMLQTFYNPVVLPKFSSLFTKVFDAVTRKDEDFYIFTTLKNTADEILLSETASEIKFKFAIYELEEPEKSKENAKNKKSQKGKPQRAKASSETLNFEIKTICFYCNNSGPKVIKLFPPVYLNSVSNQDRFKWRQNPISLPSLFPDFARNGYGHALQISSAARVFFFAELEQDPQQEGQWRLKRGNYKTLIEELVRVFNYTYNVWPSSFGGGTGTILKNGTWVGGVRDIMDKRADIAIPVSPNYSRYKLAGFSNTICYAWVNFVVGPPKVTYTWKAVYQPFAGALWTATTVAFIGSVLMTRLFGKLHNSVLRKKYDKNDLFNRHLWTWNLSVILEQDVVYPTIDVQRMVFGVFLFCSVIITCAYRTKLVEFMAFPNYISQPKTFPKLLKAQKEGFSWGFESSAVGSSAHNHFKSSTSPVYSQMYKKMTTEKDSFTCYNKAVKESFACISWSGTSEYIMYKNFSDKYGRNPLRLSEDLTLFVSSGYVLQKRALFRTAFDRLIDSTREMNMNERWKILDYQKLLADRLAWEKKEGISNDLDDEIPEGALILANLQGPLYILVVGSLFGLFVWIWEIVKYKALKAKEEKKHLIQKKRLTVAAWGMSALIKFSGESFHNLYQPNDPNFNAHRIQPIHQVSGKRARPLSF